jgi:hypothetical protein
MKTVEDIATQYAGDLTISSPIKKIDVVSKTSDGGFHLDLFLLSGEIIEAAVPAEKLAILRERLLEEVFFVIKPLDEPNRYECTCMVFGKAPEFKH